MALPKYGDLNSKKLVPISTHHASGMVLSSWGAFSCLIFTRPPGGVNVVVPISQRSSLRLGKMKPPGHDHMASE